MVIKSIKLMTCSQAVLGFKMYFIEYIIKKFTKKKENATYNPVLQSEKQDYEDCEHVYMPIDSTGEVLSCTKCGILASQAKLKDELKNKNFFMQDN